MSAPPSRAWRAVLVDLDDTLVPWHTVSHWQWAWRPQGPILPARHALAAIRRSLHHWDRRRWQGLVGSAAPVTGADAREALRAELAEIAGHRPPPAETEAVVDRFLRPAGEAESFPDALGFSRSIEERGLRLGTATDLPAATARLALRRAGLSESLLVLAGDDPDGHLPAAAAFRVAADRLGAKPRETLYAGDLFWSDVRAAARAGLFAVLLDRPDRQPKVTGPRVRTLAGVLDLLSVAPAASAGPSPGGGGTPATSTESSPR